MSTPFAAIEAATATAAVAALANAAATIGGATVSGIFDNGFDPSFGNLVGDRVRSFTCKTSDLGTITPGTTTVTIAGTAYTVAEVQPDGTGVTVLALK